MGLAIMFSLLCLISLINLFLSFHASAQTDGFTAVPLSQSNFMLHKPYDVAANERYSFINGVHRMWVYSTDKPHTNSTTNNSKPRTEIKIQGYDYSSGVWQFEGEAYVPSGTSGTCIMQAFGGSSRNTTIILRVYNGTLTVYTSPTIESNIYNRWFKVNVIHDTGARNVEVYINNGLRYDGPDDGGSNHYFKFGVYGQNDESNYMESRWRGIRVLRKN